MKHLIQFEKINYLKDLISNTFNDDYENNLNFLVSNSNFSDLNMYDIMFLINISDKLDRSIKLYIFKNKHYDDRIVKLIKCYQEIEKLNKEADNYFKDTALNNKEIIYNDSISYYINSLPEKILSFEELVLLYKKYEQGDNTAKEQIIFYNLRYVVAIAKKFVNKGIDLEDLIQVGNEGLITAVEKYDYTLGISFTTYSRYWIYQKISRYLSQDSNIIRIPYHLNENVIKIKKFISDYFILYGDKPDIDTIKDKFKLSSNKVNTILEIINYCGVFSLNNNTVVYRDGNDEQEYEEMLENMVDDDFNLEEDYITKELYDKLRNYVFNQNNLSERGKQIISYRFGFVDGKEYSFSQISKIFNISKERTRQIFNGIIEKLIKNENIRTLK